MTRNIRTTNGDNSNNSVVAMTMMVILIIETMGMVRRIVSGDDNHNGGDSG